MSTCDSLVQKSVPEKDIVKEAERVIEAAERNQINLRLFGGLAVRFHCPRGGMGDLLDFLRQLGQHIGGIRPVQTQSGKREDRSKTYSGPDFPHRK